MMRRACGALTVAEKKKGREIPASENNLLERVYFLG